jgi:hypothetical protein
MTETSAPKDGEQIAERVVRSSSSKQQAAECKKEAAACTIIQYEQQQLTVTADPRSPAKLNKLSTSARLFAQEEREVTDRPSQLLYVHSGFSQLNHFCCC